MHDYVRVDDAIVYGILKKHLGDFEAFARAVTAYLRRSRTSSP
ncbi:HepT-like ribonuclease domain-containing protein [Thermoflexus hugenholtzii]